ncbi:MAG: PAS domain S-box protein, partial [Rhodospirillales bacterium]|nr:PAS domain S-box protein [Rhodospirillales bacterium]
MPVLNLLRLTRESAVLRALRGSFAVIEYSPKGVILDANEQFLRSVGYTKAELIGRHHNILMPPKDAASPDYATFWADLAKGVLKTG